MTKRERYLRALRNQEQDQLVWAPNFDYWLSVNRAAGTLPPAYRELSRNDIVRAIGGTIWNRAGGLREVLDPSVTRTHRTVDGLQVTELHTPLGTLRNATRATESAFTSRFLCEHFVKTVADLRIMQYAVEATHYEANYEPTLKALQETGDDGVVLNSCFCVPFIQFAKTDVGYTEAFLMWADHQEECEKLVRAYWRLFLQGYEVLAQGPADIIATGDNMDGLMISPRLFREQAVPFYQEAAKIVHAGGKLFEGHWCGRTQNLLPHTPGCGLDIVEAIVTRPMADVSLADAIGMLRGEVVLQGGIPSVMVCSQGCTAAEFERYVRETVVPLRGRRGYIVGMSDNVPPNADFARVEAIAGLLAG